MKNIWLIDIDGTICEDIPNEEADRFATAELLPGAKEKVDELTARGDRIVFFTARTEFHKASTEYWLSKNGFKYESVVYGKPRISEGWKYNWVDNKDVEGHYVPGGIKDLALDK